MTATTKNAPGIRGNGPEGNDNNPTVQEGAEVMPIVPPNSASLFNEIAAHLDRWVPIFRENRTHEEVLDAIRTYTSAGNEYVDAEWLGDDAEPWTERWGAPHCANITPGALPSRVRTTTVDRIVAEPYIDDDTTHVTLLTACESEEHDTPLTLEEAEAFGHAILAAVTAARTRLEDRKAGAR